MRRLLIATDNYLPRRDGISVFLSTIIPLLKKSFKVSVIAPDYKGRRMREFVPTVRVPLSGITIGDYPLARIDRERVKAAVKGADIVWVQALGPIGFPALHYAKKFGKKVVAYTHSIEWELVSYSMTRMTAFVSLIQRVVKAAARHYYNKCDLIIVPAEETAEILEASGITAKTEVVSLGIDASRFVPPKSKPAAKRALGISPGCRVVGYVGRIAREKDIPTLVKAFHLVRQRRRNAKLLIVGAGLENEIPNEKGIISIGSVDNVVPYLQAMDVYVLPSLTETTSLSTMEAMCCGVPVITTRVGLVKHYVNDGDNGFFFRKRDFRELALKVEAILDNDFLRQKIGESARKSIFHSYSWKNSTRKIIRAISRL